MTAVDRDRPTTRPAEDDLLRSLFPGTDDTSVLARATDWGATALGAPEGWSPELAAAIRTVLPASIPMLLWWGDELVQVYNDPYRVVCGAKHPRAMGQPAAECWPEAWPELGPRVRRVVRDGVSDHEPSLLLLLERHGFVEETYWRYSFSPVRSADGTVLGVFVATTEVSDVVVEGYRTGLLHELAVFSSTRFATAEDAAGRVSAVLAREPRAVPFCAVYLPDTAGHLVRVAGHGVSHWGTALPARVALDAEHPVARTARTREVRRTRASAATLRAEPDALTGADPTEVAHLPLGTEDGPLEGVLCLGLSPHRPLDAAYEQFLTLLARQTSTLLGDVRAAGAERARAAAYAELDAAKSAFFANVSHEFRTPLTVVLAAVRELRAGEPAAADLTHLDAVERAATRLDRLVGSLLDVARAEAGRLEVETELVDLSRLTREVVSMFRSSVEAAGLRLELEVEDGVVGRAHPDAWYTVVANLLSNAYRFTAEGSIRVSLSGIAGVVVLEVTDTGVGLDGEPDALLERFHRGPGRPVRGSAGTGIGLAHVRDLLLALGGTIDLGPAEAGGTRVRASVPRAPDGPTTSVSADRSVVTGLLEDALGPERRPAVPPDPAGPDDGPCVLLVEDHPDVRDYLTRLLVEDGWRVRAVPDVPSAVALDEVPELLLCDVMLPGPSGLDLVRALRARQAWIAVPIVLLTARTGAREVAEGLAAGADDHVTKPFDPVELLARLRTHHELAGERARLLERAEDRAANLEVALRTNRTIGMAVGVLMADRRISSEQAFELLRGLSTRSNRKLRAVAEDVVRTGRLAP